MTAVEQFAGDVPHGSPYFSEEHEALRDQVRRFVETEIKPHALAWEEEGFKILDKYGIEYCDRSVSLWEVAGRAVAKIESPTSEAA